MHHSVIEIFFSFIICENILISIFLNLDNVLIGYLAFTSSIVLNLTQLIWSMLSKTDLRYYICLWFCKNTTSIVNTKKSSNVTGSNSMIEYWFHFYHQYHSFYSIISIIIYIALFMAFFKLFATITSNGCKRWEVWGGIANKMMLFCFKTSIANVFIQPRW